MWSGRRYRGQRSEQKIAERRKTDLTPLTSVRVDYFVPTEVKRGHAIIKRYGVIFTCMASRAVHLEIAYCLSTDSCINATRRFVCRRGQVCRLRSDNGTSFVGTEQELREALAAIVIARFKVLSCQKGIDWLIDPGISTPLLYHITAASRSDSSEWSVRSCFLCFSNNL